MTTASIVLHRTDTDMLRRALTSLGNTHVARIYLIDNSPTPSDPSELTRGLTLPPVEYEHVENRGFGAAHNVALRRAMKSGSTYHLVLNPDVEWQGDAVTPLTDYLDANPDVALVGPRVVYPDGTLQYSCRMLPTPFDLVFKRFMPASWSRRRMHRYLLAGADHSQPFECQYLLGSFMLFRVDALRSEGLFDERFFMYPEDIDISRRLGRKHRVMYLPITTVVHRHMAASRTNGRMLRIHIYNMSRYFNKWGWWFDSYRRQANRRLLLTMPHPERPEPPGRG